MKILIQNFIIYKDMYIFFYQGCYLSRYINLFVPSVAYIFTKVTCKDNKKTKAKMHNQLLF